MVRTVPAAADGVTRSQSRRTIRLVTAQKYAAASAHAAPNAPLVTTTAVWTLGYLSVWYPKRAAERRAVPERIDKTVPIWLGTPDPD
jgi:hypothetical protein